MFIDRAFLEWIEPKMLNLDIKATDLGAAGHVVLKPLGKVLLDRFEDRKRAFDNGDTFDIQLPHSLQPAPGSADIANGILTISK